MESERTQPLETSLRRNLTRALRRHSTWGHRFGEIFALLRGLQLNCFLFGGTVRDILLHGPARPPRDLDIVLDAASFEEFASIFPAKLRKRNRFGGIKCDFKAVEIDAWPLESTWALRKGFRSGSGFEVLPSTAFFNLDAIVAEIAPQRWQKRRIFESGFLDGVVRRQIDCNLELTDFPELNVVRGFVFAQKTGFHFSNRFCRFLVESVVRQQRNDFANCQLDHYGKIRFPVDLIVRTVDEIRRILNRDPQSTFLPRFPGETQLEFEFDPDPSWFRERLAS